MNEYIVDGQVYQVSNELLEDFLKKYPNAQLSEKTEPVKKQAVAESVADVTAINEQIATGQSTDLGSENIFLDLEKANNINQKFSKDTDGITTDKTFLTKNQVNDLTEEIDVLSESVKEKEKEPSVLKSILSRGAKGWVKMVGKDLTGFRNDMALTAYASYRDLKEIFTGEESLSTPEKQALRAVAKNIGSPKNLLIATATGDSDFLKVGSVSYYNDIIEDLEENIRKTESQSITEALTKGDWSEAAELAAGGVLESTPSLAAAFTGYGGIALLGASVAGGKFDEEFEKNPEESIQRLAANAIGSGATEATFELVTRGLLKKAGLIGQKNGAQSAKDFLKQSYLNISKRLGIDTSAEAASEGATVIASKIWDSISLNRELDLTSNEALYEIYDGAILGSIYGLGISSVGELGSATSAARNRAEYILSPITVQRQYKDASIQISDLTIQYKEANSDRSKKVILNKINEIENNIVNAKKEVSKALNSLSPQELAKYAKNQDEIGRDQIALQKETNKDVIKTIKNNIDNLQQENYNMFSVAASRALEKEVTQVEKVAEKVGAKVTTFETIKDFQKAYPDTAATVDGFITPEGEIVINKEQAAKVGAVTTASHELLHRIIESDLSDSSRRKEIIDDFKNQLSPEELSVVQKRIDENYRYDDKGNELPESEYNEEYLTAFSDAVGKGDIKYNENLFTKIKDFVLNILKPKGYTNLNFQSGKDVYDFIKDYQKNIKKGKISKRAEELSKIKPVSEIKTRLSKSDSDAVQTIFEQKGKEGAFEIIEKFKPITNKIVQRRSEAPGFDRQLLTDEIETGKRGILDLISEYKPESGVPLAAYINKFLPARAIEASNRVLDTEFKLDVTEARGVTDTTTEEVTETVAQKPTKAKESLRETIKIDQKTSDKIRKAVIKTFGTKLPSLQSSKFKKAIKKAFKTELKTTIAKDVLGSRTAYETFLRDNFKEILNALPQETINKRFRPFAEDTGKREKTKEGKKIFKKKDITKAEFINYFLGRDVGTSTKGTRKDALAEALAEEYALDATMETLQQPEVLNKFKDILALQDNIVANEIELVSKQIERSPDLKFSKSQQVFEKDSLKLLSLVQKENVEDIFNEEGKLIGEYEGKFVDEARDLIWDTYSEGIIDDEKGLKFKQLVYNSKNIPKKIIEQFKEQGAFRYNKDSKNLLNKNNKTIIKQLGSDILNIMGYDFLGYYNRALDPAATKKDKITKKIIAGAKGEYFDSLKEIKNSIKNIKSKLPKDLNLEDVSLMNKVFPLFKAINKIQASEKSKAEKIIELQKLKPQIEAANEANIKLAEFITNTIGNLYLDGKIDGLTVLNLMQLQTNAVKGIRALTSLDFITLESGSQLTKQGQTYLESKGEHLAPSSNSMFELAEIILNPKTTKESLAEDVSKVFKNHTQWLTTKELTKVIDKKGGQNNPTNRNRIKFLERKDINNVVGFDGKSYEEFMVDIAIIEARKQALEKSEEKAKVYNEKILPPVINAKFSKSTTNQEVLNEMERLDTEAQDARIKFSKSKNLNKDFNDIIERATGIGTEKRYGQTKARAVGADKGKFNLLGIPPSAQDFVGLTRYFAGKGKQGDETIAWVKENFLDPFARANIDISNARVALANDFKALKQLLGVSPKDLNKKITGEPYTVGNAVRVYTWIQQGMTIPGLSKTDQKILEDYVAADENLVTFANELIAINKDNGYPKPTDGWLAGTITTDLLSGLNTVVRAKYLKQWQNNVDEVFSETNMNKLEAAYGKGYRDALENMLGRMKTGSNRGFKGDTLTGRFIDWINNSVGAIMFFNMRSAVLQTISAVNFVNWSDNNPLKASAAFANQPQYWKDVMKLMNSDYLVERRNGLKINVSEADIAEIAAESKNKAKAFISKILKLGFLPTQIADSFAIASGGATFYRNRYKSLKKEGLSDKEAEAQAFQDFREIAEESQQSSRPDRISQQQAGPMGRIILAFANTPAQYARLMQKAASDLKNRRGDNKTNISKILYYGAIQNVIFNALQQALFAMAFGDEEPDEEKLNKKYTGIANGMADSLLRGVGFHGAAISTLKNVVMKLAEGKEAQDAAIELLDISPPISSKIGKLKSAGRTWDWNKEEIMEKGWSLDNPAYLAAGQVISAATNVPLDRGIRKLQNLKDASDAENEEWMRVANALGWAKWELEWAKNNEVAFTGKRKIKRSKLKSNKRKVKRN